MQLVIPGRPQAKLVEGRSGTYRVPGGEYVDAIRQAARAAGLGRNGHPRNPHGHVHVDLLLIYTSDENLPPTSWPDQSIPNADTAATLVLKALTGIVWTHATQANPLHTTRRVMTRAECRATYGSIEGATVIKIAT